MSYAFNLDSAVVVELSVALGVWIGIHARRALAFVAFVLTTPIGIAEGFYLAELIHLRILGRGSNESWAGLVVPILAAGSFAFLAPVAFGTAGIRWLLSRYRKGPGKQT